MDDFQTDGGPEAEGPVDAESQAGAGAQSAPDDPAGESDAQIAQYIQQANDQFVASLPSLPTLPVTTFLRGGGPDQSGLPSTYFGNAANGALMPTLGAAFGKISPQAMQDIRNFGTALDIVPHSVADLYGLSGPNGQPPGGYPDGSTWDNVAGAYLPGSNNLVFSTDGQVPTGSPYLALHEIGHAHDSALGAKLNVAPDAYGVQNASNSPGFQAAYEADKNQLAIDDAGLEANYYVQPDAPNIRQNPENGRNETYAESFANFYNGNKDWAQSHPNLNQWFENLDNNQTRN